MKCFVHIYSKVHTVRYSIIPTSCNSSLWQLTLFTLKNTSSKRRWSKFQKNNIFRLIQTEYMHFLSSIFAIHLHTFYWVKILLLRVKIMFPKNETACNSSFIHRPHSPFVQHSVAAIYAIIMVASSVVNVAVIFSVLSLKLFNRTMYLVVFLSAADLGYRVYYSRGC